MRCNHPDLMRGQQVAHTTKSTGSVGNPLPTRTTKSTGITGRVGNSLPTRTLEAPLPDGARRVIGTRLAEGQSTVTITRAGTFNDPRYGTFSITPQMLAQMVGNFERRTYGQDVFLDVAHRPEDGAAAKITALRVENGKLLAEVEWTDYGRKAVRERGFTYLSAEYVDDYIDNEHGQHHGALLLGAGLTVRPVIKRLDPITLSTPADSPPTALDPNLISDLRQHDMKEWIKKLQAALAKKQLSEPAANGLVKGFEGAAKLLGEKPSDEQMQQLLESFVGTAEQLAAVKPGASEPVQLSVTLPEPTQPGLTAADVSRILAEHRKAEADQAKQLADSLAARQKQFDDALAAAEGLKQLSEDDRKQLSGARDLITAGMDEEQVRKLAEYAITQGNQRAVQQQLAARGWGPSGSVQISLDESNTVKRLQETVDKRLGLAGLSDAQRYSHTGGQLLAENKALAEKAMAMFDKLHGRQLHQEAKQLAGGDGVQGDLAVPKVWERTVIREALYNLVGAQFANVDVWPYAAVYSIPYTYRDTTAAGRGNTRTYEGGAIPRAGVIQTAEEAYNIPQKLSFSVSDEMQYLTDTALINYDAVADNQRNASRIINEDTDKLILDEHINASDEYGAVAVTNEDLELQADGTDEVFVLANFPVVRPRKIYNLAGVQVGNTVNPITVSYDSTPVLEWDGTGDQAAGVYYVLDYNLGEITLVDEAGAVQTPADATAYTISYSYATNVYNFDSDLPASTAAKTHWDTFLYRYGLRKAVLQSERYHMANFGAMTSTLMTAIEQAEKFAANFRVPGTDLAADGTLGRIKAVPNFEVFGPGLVMADNRVLIGERGTVRYRLTKPWMLGMLKDEVNSDGLFVGKKSAYGDQFVVVHTPTQLKRALTTINVYSATARVARPAA